MSPCPRDAVSRPASSPSRTAAGSAARAALVGILVALLMGSPPGPAEIPGPHLGARGSHSFSILGYDPLTGDFGVAAASNAPLIGVNLDYLDPDVGGVVVHGGPHLELNRRALTALREGVPARTAIAVGLVADPERERRQVLAISSDGPAVFSGDRLEKRIAHRMGEDFVAAGHRLESDGVADAMAAAFEAADGPLDRRLLAALVAGRDAGGEVGGARSAALLVVGPGAEFASRGRKVDLRIDFTPEDAIAALVALKVRVDSVYGVAADPPQDAP